MKGTCLILISSIVMWVGLGTAAAIAREEIEDQLPDRVAQLEVEHSDTEKLVLALTVPTSIPRIIRIDQYLPLL